jgi:hypothetical protein
MLHIYDRIERASMEFALSLRLRQRARRDFSHAREHRRRRKQSNQFKSVSQGMHTQDEIQRGNAAMQSVSRDASGVI